VRRGGRVKAAVESVGEGAGRSAMRNEE
jgi:hypothetical protein